jgi:transaldolase/transaldolase/glucose-6-phosphate isomerase
MEQNKIKAIKDFGQSIWLDFFDREIMNSGRLKKMIEEDGISGVTSISFSFFKKRLVQAQTMMRILKGFGIKKTYDGIFFNLAIRDIKRVANIFQKRV